MVPIVDRAQALAESELAAEVPRRWSHVQAVAAKAAEVAESLLDGSDTAIVVAAAWLHDVSYGPRVANTGFHSLDGARWLRRQGFDERVAALVAHHSCAQREADERGLDDDLAWEFEHEASPVSDVLWYADMTTGPDGQSLDVTVRLGEIRTRYGVGDVVTRFISRAEPEIVAAVHRVEERLRAMGGG